MARRLHFCDPSGFTWKELVYEDAALVSTAMGPVQADQLVGSSKALLTVLGAGGDLNGNVEIAARHGGVGGNALRFSIEVGPTGTGYEDLPLRVTRFGNDFRVFFGTNSGGVSIQPTAQQVADTINGDQAVSAYIRAAAGGTGAGDADTAALANLAGGADNGEHYKMDGRPPAVVRINTVDVE